MRPLPPELDHWHPVLLSRDLGRRPRRVRLLGTALALFRTPDGAGALLDACPHRGMSLATGQVRGSDLVCPYHGYCFSKDGTGRSRGNPKMRIAATAFETREAHGALWVRRAGAGTAFPAVIDASARFVGASRTVIEAPLEPVIDNFCEVEHTPTTHALFGHDLDGIAEVRTTVVAEEGRVTVVNEGPQRPLPAFVRRLFDLGPSDLFVDAWDVRASPPHIVYDQFWRDPATGAPRPHRLHLSVFFTPEDAGTTSVFAFVGRRDGPGPLPVPRAVGDAILRAFVAREIRLDRAMIERLADLGTGLEGRRLGRFDKALGAYRRLLDRVYRDR
jgi:nitrite reductase/ring-hydroxylating ferredoxin subunit